MRNLTFPAILLSVFTTLAVAFMLLVAIALVFFTLLAAPPPPPVVPAPLLTWTRHPTNP